MATVRLPARLEPVRHFSKKTSRPGPKAANVLKDVAGLVSFCDESPIKLKLNEFFPNTFL